MASFVEALLAEKIDCAKEINKLETLYYQKTTWKGYWDSASLSEMVDANFRSWTHRKTYIDAMTLREDTGIQEIISKAQAPSEPISLEEFATYLEYLLNMVAIIHSDSEDFVGKSIVDNIAVCLDSIHYFVPNIDEHGALYRVVPSDPLVTKAIETTKDADLADLLFEYVHHSSKHDLSKKSMLLGSIWKRFEARRKDVEAFNGKLASEIGKLANKCDIRHDLKPEEAAVWASLSSEEKEALYDSLFNLYVDAFATLDATDEIDKAEKLLA